jgi:hypothetical protein
MNEHKRNLDLPHQEPSFNVGLHPTGCWLDGSIETNYLCGFKNAQKPKHLSVSGPVYYLHNPILVNM